MKSFFGNILLFVGISAIVLLLFQLSLDHARGGESAPLLSSVRYDPYGTAAVKEFLKESGSPVYILNKSSLNSVPGGVMLQTVTLRLSSPREFG